MENVASIWTWLTDTFSNREISTGVWFIVFVVAVLAIKSVREMVPDIVKATFQWKLIVLFGTFGLWVVCLAWFYKQVGLWSDSQLFATLFWAMLNGFPLLGRSLSAAEDDAYFKKTLWDNFKLLGLFEFIVVAYSFSLVAELIVVPILAFAAVMSVVAGWKEETRSVQRLFELITAAFVFYVVFLSINQIIDAPEKFFVADTGRNFILPMLFSVGSIPIIYIWFCISHIENAKLGINFKTFQSDALKAYARKRFFLIFAARPWLLKRAVRQFQTLPAENNADVDRIIQDIYTYEREAEEPPVVDPSLGWSPYLARQFLAGVGLRTNDYHDDGYDGTWWASAPYVDLDEETLPNIAAFYLEGRKGVVQRLKLTGKFRDGFDASVGLGRLQELSLKLVSEALRVSLEDASAIVPDTDEYAVDVGDVAIKRWSERYHNETGFEVFVTLTKGKGVDAGKTV